MIDETRGRAVEMYVSLNKGLQPSRAVEDKVTATIEHEIGKIARPKHVWIVPDMPKTRSGKIMHRVMAAISNFADVGDVSTLANPQIVDGIKHHIQREKLAHGAVPRQLTLEETAEILAFGNQE